MQFKSRIELDNYLGAKIADAMDEVYERLYEKLKEIIKKDVYSTSGSFYQPTYDLLDDDNWEVSVKKGRKYWNGEIKFTGNNWTEPSNFYDRENPEMYTHGNYFSDFEADDFLKYLNSGKTYDTAFNFPSIQREPFWDDFMDYCKKWYPILFENACKRNGIPLNRGGQFTQNKRF